MMLRFHIAGLDVGVSFWFFALLSACALVQQGELMFYLLLPVAVHELGHLLMMAAVGAEVRGVQCTASGIAIQRDAGCRMSYGREFLICAAGPAVNLALAGWLHLCCFHSVRTMFLVAANVAVGVFNLLPIGDLDGGQMLKLAAARWLPAGTAHRVSRVTAFAALGMLFGLAFFVLGRGWYNPTLLLACAYLAVNVIIRE